MRRRFALGVFISALLAWGPVVFAVAADYYVDADAGDDANDGSEGTPWRTITHALDWIASNNPGSEGNAHTIHAAAGTYSASTNGETFPLNMQSWVSLEGEDAETTILDGEQGAYHIVCCCDVGDLAIAQLNMTGGYADGPDDNDKRGAGIWCCRSSPTILSNTISENEARWGGGVCAADGSSPDISGNVISGNSAVKQGGAIFCEESSPAVSNNTISDNSAENFGAAIFCSNSSPTVVGNAIEGNSAGMGGGGISCWDGGSPLISDNTIEGNSGVKGGGVHGYESSPTIANNVIEGNTTRISGWGGGIYCIYGSMTVINNLIVDNYASSFDGGGIYCYDSSIAIQNNTIVRNTVNFGRGDGIFCEGSSETITDCIIWDNGDDLFGCSATYCCIEDDDSGEGNIHEDPDFVTGPLGDYYLRGGGPCIDAGSRSAASAGLSDRTTQVDDTLDSGTVDMGYHYPISAGPELSDPTHSPDYGRLDAEFTFTVHYYHSRGLAPSRIQVFVNGTPHSMKLDSGSAADGIYAWTGKIPQQGLSQYHFEAEDSYGSFAVCLRR